MLQNNKARSVSAFLLACFVTLSGCAGGGKPNQPAAAPPQGQTGDSSAESQPAQAANKVHLKVGGVRPQDDDPESKHQDFAFWSKMVEEKFPNIEFEWDRWAPGEDYRQQYDQQLMAGNAPNVGAYFPYVDIQTRLANGTIGDLTEYVNNWDLKKQGLVTTVFDQAISTADNKWYAVPAGPYVSGIVINMSVLKEAGLDPNSAPATWSDFAKVAQEATDKTVPRFGFLLLGSDFNAWTYTPWVWSAGGEMVKDNGDGTWNPSFAEDPGVDAAMFMHDLVWKHNATQKNILESYDDFSNHFKAGEGVFGWGSPPQFAAEDLAKFDQKQEDISFMPLPGKDSGGHTATFAGGEVFTVNPKNSKEENDAAWQYITYYGYDPDFLIPHWENQNKLGTLNANPATRTDLVEKKYSIATSWPSHWAKQMADGFANAQPEPYCAHWNDLKNEIVKPLQTIYLGENITWDEAKALLAECAKTLCEKYPGAFKIP